MARWPRPLALAVRRAQARPRSRARPGPAAALCLPPWIAVPVALDAAYGPRRSRALLADAVWGQYCLFQCVRLQDDVFDGHTAERALVYAADQFLIEAERAFARHFPFSARFWEIYRRAVETTTRSIVAVDDAQKRLGCAPAWLAREYAKVGAIFKVGASAVCLAHRRSRDLTPLGRFFDAIAMGDQILDDLEDVDDDLRRGRFNYVAQRLCIGARGSFNEEAARRAIVRALAVGDGAERVLGDARRHFARAAAIAARLRVSTLGAVAATALRSVADRQRAFHEAQVERVLGPIVRQRGASSAKSRTADAVPSIVGSLVE